MLYAEHLDMRPYLSSTVLRKRYALRGDGAGFPASTPAAPHPTLYELYAVVCHLGKIQASLHSRDLVLVDEQSLSVVHGCMSSFGTQARLMEASIPRIIAKHGVNMSFTRS